MKVASLLHCFAVFGAALAQEAYLYTFDISPKTKQSLHEATAIVTPDIGFSIIQRRRGIAENRYLNDIQPYELQSLDSFGGFQQAVFGYGQSRPMMRLLLTVEGFGGDEMKLGTPDLSISPISNDFARGITRSNTEFSAMATDGVRCYKIYVDGDIDTEYSVFEGNGSKAFDLLERTDVEPLAPLATAWKEMIDASMHDSTPDTLTEYLRPVLSILSSFALLHQIQSTLLLLPHRVNLTTSKDVHRRAESPLDLPAESSTQESESSHIEPLTFKPLPSPLSACYSSKSACMNTTNSCMGHGSCVKSVANSKCFQCKCTSTLVGTNRWYWGGNACEKKDVSVPFFLFATFGVVMTALVAGGIGLLYGVGNQELPSVLGAGVAGPRATK